jgi:hypothetical protein
LFSLTKRKIKIAFVEMLTGDELPESKRIASYHGPIPATCSQTILLKISLFLTFAALPIWLARACSIFFDKKKSI